MTFVILACALPSYNVWWPMIVILFYLLAPLPTFIARGRSDLGSGRTNAYMDFAIFITMGLVVSSFALPIIFSRSPVGDPLIQPGACNFTLAGNIVVYLTYLGFFMTLFNDETSYAGAY